MKIACWNINGIRACYRKGFLDWIDQNDLDIIGLQEIKAKEEQFPPEILAHPNYNFSIFPAKRPGYSGTACLVRKDIKLSNVTFGTGKKEFDDEGRTIILEHPKFTLFNCYFPNGGRDLSRVPFKLKFCRNLAQAVNEYKTRRKHPVIVMGDYNTAHTEIDLKNPKANQKTTGFLPEERAWIDEFMADGYVDVFRHLHPEEPDHYTWWTYRNNCRERNIGWRIDYFFLSRSLLKKVKHTKITPHVMGSDHCPIELELEL